MSMLIVVKVLLVYLLLWLVLWVFSRFFHQTLYTDVPRGLHWRSAAAAGVLWGLGLLFPLVANGLFGWSWPITFDDYFVGRTLTEADEREFRAFVVSTDTGERRYELRRVTLGLRQERQYIAEGEERLIPASLAPEEGSNVAAKPFKGIWVTRDDERKEMETVFLPQRELSGLRFVSDDGHTMAAEEFGVVRLTAAGGFLMRMLVFALLAAASFATFAFLLEFTRGHALLCGLGIAILWVFLLNLIQWAG